jgi:transposase
VIPRIRQSGKRRFTRGPAIPLGNARLRKALWMVVLQLIRRNAWLRKYYEHLRAAGKPSLPRCGNYSCGAWRLIANPSYLSSRLQKW